MIQPDKDGNLAALPLDHPPGWLRGHGMAKKTTNKPRKAATDKYSPQSDSGNIKKASRPWHHELIVPDVITFHDPSSRIPPEHYLLWNPDLGEAEVRRILKQGFFPVAPLIMEMQKSDDWDAALPSVWKLLCCEAIPGMPQNISMPGGDRFFVLNKVFRAAMGDLGIDYQHYRRLGPPPLLTPHRPEGNEWVKAERGRGQEYFESWINIEEFKAWIDEISQRISVSFPMPEILLAVERIEEPLTARAQKPLELVPGTTWEDIYFSLKSNELVHVRTPAGESRLMFSDLGFQDKRKGDKPNKTTWVFFLVLAVCQGDTRNESDKIKKHISQADMAKFSERARRLDAHLKKVFGINESIYKGHYRKFNGYVTRFNIQDHRQS
jgi:hypothetical protein